MSQMRPNFYMWYDIVMKHAIWCVGVALIIALVAQGCATKIAPPRGVSASVRTMEITGYCKCGECCGWRRNWRFKAVIASGASKGQRKQVGVTASGTKARLGTIAADTAHYPFGTVMHIPGYGYGRVEDRGSAIKGPHRIDLYFKDHKDAVKWGRRSDEVTVWLPGG
jgi:3D (Asp-Asp-Asp) domain-containing protein